MEDAPGNGSAQPPVAQDQPQPAVLGDGVALASPAAKPKFGRLESEKVRDHFKDEAQDFTPWLAEEENLALLGETIGADLTFVGREYRIGPFRADIVAKDGEDNLVVIENQLEATDHRHLGQLLVYAADREAKTVVWIARTVMDEYRKVIDWLNEETSTHFWALEIELWRIGASDVAPKFNIVCEPNELTKPAGAAESPELSANKLLQQEFWTAMNEYFEQHGSPFNARKPRPQHWHPLPIGTSRAHITLTALVGKSGRVGCELYIRDAQADAIYEALEQQKAEVEQQLGELEWQPLPDKKASRVAQYKDANIEDRESWPQLFAWLKDTAEKFKATFADRVRQVQLEVETPEPAAVDASPLASEPSAPPASANALAES